MLAFFAAGVWAVLGDDSFDLWYFGIGEHSSRLARGLFAAALGVVIYLIWQSFAVRRPPLKLPDRAELERARTIYDAHGGGEFAHLTFMGDKHLFWSADGQSVVAYGSVRDRLVALGSPSGPENAIKRAILDFRHFADAQDRVPVFYEVLEPDLSLYHDLGFDLFKLGELATIQLNEFTLAGKRWEDLRQAVNRSVKERLTFEIVEPPFDTVLMTEVEYVSDVWLEDKGASEKGFSLGRFGPDYFAWSPLALVRRDGELVAFANVLPPYGPHGTASVDLMRHVADAPRGTMDLLFAKVMQWAKDRGYETFSLGMAPLSAVGDNPYARINERLAALAFQYGGRFYNYQGLRRYKEKFAPEWTGSYLAYPRGLRVPGLADRHRGTRRGRLSPLSVRRRLSGTFRAASMLFPARQVLHDEIAERLVVAVIVMPARKRHDADSRRLRFPAKTVVLVDAVYTDDRHLAGRELGLDGQRFIVARRAEPVADMDLEHGFVVGRDHHAAVDASTRLIGQTIRDDGHEACAERIADQHEARIRILLAVMRDHAARSLRSRPRASACARRISASRTRSRARRRH